MREEWVLVIGNQILRNSSKGGPAMFRLLCLMGVAVWCLGMMPVMADTIEMANGDVLNGQVISLDGKELVLKSELLGELKLAREKVSAIHLGDKPVLTRNAAQAQAVPAANKPALDPEVQKVLGAVPSTDDVLKQLQGGGVNPQMIGELQTKFPLLNTPEAGEYFNDTLGGLMSGKLSIQDVRKDAVLARDGLLDLQKDLGPEGAALNGYLSILNKFIKETEPAPGAKPPAKDQPKEAPPAPKQNTPAQFPPKP
jgi:hypothetical protein